MSSRSRSSTVDTIRLDRLVGRRVLDREGQPVGRIQEVRVAIRGSDWIVTDYLIGVAGLVERLGIGFRLLVGLRLSGHIVRADQLDVSDPRHARLTCGRDDVRAA